MSQYEPLYNSFDRMPERYVPTSRMSVSASVYLPGSDVDMYTGYLKPDRVRRRRVQGMRIERDEHSAEEAKLEKEAAKAGFRIPLHIGVLVLAVVAFVGCMSLLWLQGRIASLDEQNRLQQQAISAWEEKNALLQDEIDAASDRAVICYAASQNLNMVPAESAVAIHLEAMDTRPVVVAAQQEQQVVDTGLHTLQVQPEQGTISASKEFDY